MSLLFFPIILRKPFVIIAIAVTGNLLLSCDEAAENKTIADNRTSLQAATLPDDMYANRTDPHQFYTSIQQMPLAQIAEIHTYFNIERWNAAKNQDKADDILYEAGAKALQIPVKQLKEADDYYLYQMIKPLDTVVKHLYKRHPNLELHSDKKLTASAYAGMHTLNTGLIVYGGNDEKEIKELAARLADSIATTLPAWITGVKFTTITRKDTVLQTSDKIDAGFIWQRGKPLISMNKSSKGFGKWKAKECSFWDNPEWNNSKSIAHPVYKTITVGAVAAAQ